MVLDALNELMIARRENEDRTPGTVNESLDFDITVATSV